MRNCIIPSLKKHHKMKETGIKCSNIADVGRRYETYYFAFVMDGSHPECFLGRRDCMPCRRSGENNR